MKKIISLVLALTMVIGCLGGVVFADESLEALVLSVKQRLGVPEGYSNLSSEQFSDGIYEMVRLEWRDESDKKFIAVEVTKSGIITDYYTSAVKAEKGISEFTKEQSTQIAKAWFEKINPSLTGKYVFSADDVYMGYGIAVPGERYSDGAKVIDDSVNVRLNGQTGEVSYMNLRYTEEEFAVPQNIISKDEAKTKFGENTNLMLAYLKSGDKAIPVYIDYEAAYMPSFGIDAVSGEKIEIERSYFRDMLSGGANKEEAKDDAVGNVELTEKEIEELSKYDSFISKEDGVAKIKAISEFGISDYRLERYSYQKSYLSKEESGGEVSLSLVLRSEKGYVHAELNAVTGDIISFFCNPNEEIKTKKITSDEGDKIADKLLEKLAKGKTYKRVAQSDNMESLTREIGYLETVNGIPFVDSGASVTVDKTTGKVTAYSANWNTEELNFETTENVMENSVAHNTYLEECEYELVYVNTLANDSIVYSEDNKPYEYVLVYQRTNNPYCIDGVTGKRMTSDGEEETPSLTEYEDLEGHWAKTAIEALVDNGYLEVKEGEFRPNEHITYEDAREMMDMAGLYEGSYDGAESLTREEAVKAIICSAGYEEVGQVGEIYIPVFADWKNISEENRGFVALAKGFGVISGDKNGNFNPKNMATRGEFAVMIYNYMAKSLIKK